ncbi:Protein YzbB, partial [hydrothermal vent metagenome]
NMTNTTLPIYSLYGPHSSEGAGSFRPTAEMLAGLDVLIFDIQPVGARFYTYLTTLLYVMQVVAEHNLPLIVCDRPNPIGGEIIEGPILEQSFESFVGCGALPIRHGLTIGEAARLFNEVWQTNCDLTVIGCEGWRRGMFFDETGLPWVAPSPNMPKWETAVLYPGTCLIEGTNLSEGRGTTLPFEIIGAPWLDGVKLAEKVDELGLDGVRIRPLQFIPTDSKWQGQRCTGVQLHVTDKQTFRPVTTALHIIAAIKQQHPNEFEWRYTHFDRLVGTDDVRREIERETATSTLLSTGVCDIINSWTPAIEQYIHQRQTILLYKN